MNLVAIGYWRSAESADAWPDPSDFVDVAWDSADRDDVATYLRQGFVSAAFMGYSPCRICGQHNGALELTDGTFVWPEGLAHYVSDHAVRLPDRFLDHVRKAFEELETATHDKAWWLSQTGL